MLTQATINAEFLVPASSSIVRAFFGQNAAQMPHPLHQALFNVNELIASSVFSVQRRRTPLAGAAAAAVFRTLSTLFYPYSYICSQVALPNAEQEIFVAPGI